MGRGNGTRVTLAVLGERVANLSTTLKVHCEEGKELNEKTLDEIRRLRTETLARVDKLEGWRDREAGRTRAMTILTGVFGTIVGGAIVGAIDRLLGR